MVIKPFRILVVDDEAKVCELTKEFLEMKGDLKVSCVQSACAARECLDLVDYDAIICDYQMPDEDGISFLQTLRSVGNRIPFILFTGKGREEVVIDALNNGADLYVQKGTAPAPMYAQLEHGLRTVLEKRERERALGKSEIIFRRIFETLPMGVWLADMDGKLIMGNPAGQKIWAAHPSVGQEQYGIFKAWRLPGGEPIVPDDWALGYAVNEGRTTEWELLEIEAFDGERKTIYNWASPIRDDDGKIIGAFVLNQDITAEFNVRKALRASEGKFREYIEHSPIGVFIADEKGKYIDVNRSGTAITGYSRDELLGMSIEDITTAEDIGNAREAFKHLTEHGHITSTLGFKHKVNGNRIWKIDAVKLSPNRFIGFTQDVTANVEMDRALRMANHKLNLSSHVVRHDLSNQLMALDGFLHLAKSMGDGPHIRYLDKALEVGRRIGSIIDFSKSYDEMGIKAPEWHNIGKIVSKAIDRFGERSLTYSVEVDDDLQVHADDLILDVFINLTDNAIRHSEGITNIRFWTEERGDDLEMFFADDGQGIPHAEKDKVFQNRYGKNTGMGLYLAREVLAITGMKIDEIGEPGKGAVFRIKVPPGAHRHAHDLS